MVFPYVCTILAAGCFAALQGDRPAVWIALIAIAGVAAFATALIAAVRNAVRGLTAKQNLTIKCVQIPAYVLNFAIADYRRNDERVRASDDRVGNRD